MKQSEKSHEVDQRSAVLLAAALRQHLLLHQQMGITLYPQSEALSAFLRPQRRRSQAWGPKKSPSLPVPTSGRPKTAPKPVAQTAPPKVSVSEISTTLQHCSACSLATARRAQVLGRGKADARLMIVGAYPRCCDTGQWSFGKEEDQLLWKMMQAIGLGPEDVYLTNVVKCSPPVSCSRKSSRNRPVRGTCIRK
nr:uracil-DNA glycosylase family protein [uncultured Desulfobulbus sp.]